MYTNIDQEYSNINDKGCELLSKGERPNLEKISLCKCADIQRTIRWEGWENLT